MGVDKLAVDRPKQPKEPMKILNITYKLEAILVLAMEDFNTAVEKIYKEEIIYG